MSYAAHHGRRQPCRWGCGATVVAFTYDDGFDIQLEDTDLSDAVDITDPDRRHRLWRHHGPHLGWVLCGVPQRDGRPLRLEHDCPATPARYKPRRHSPTPATPHTPASATPTTNTARKELRVDQFDDPGPLDSIKWADQEGRLVLITPHRVERGVPNLDGDGVRDVTYGDIVILDGPDAPRIYPSSPIFPVYLQAQVRPNVGNGRSNLGRVARDESRAGRGRQAPWVLAAPTDADKQRAREYLARTTRITPAAAPVAPSSRSEDPPF